MPPRKTTDHFIADSKSVHGEQFQYSRTAYTNNNTKIRITCRIHGDFMQLPRVHLSGKGCLSCANESAKITTDEFVRRSKLAHGEKYSYELSKCSGARQDVTIICPDHGEFTQNAMRHMSGKGCYRCGKSSQKITRAEFIRRGSARHDGRYSYSLSEYVNSKTEVEIICGKHGSFMQSPERHMAGAGCIRCHGRIMNGLDDFIRMAREVFGDRYDYSKSDYQASNKKLEISCAEHGPFMKKPSKHISGQGCPLCLWDRDRPAYIYILSSDGIVKIGVSAKLEQRLDQLKKDCPHQFSLDMVFTVENFRTACSVESAAHRGLSEFRAGLSGFDGATEWFSVTPRRAEYAIRSAMKAMQPQRSNP